MNKLNDNNIEMLNNPFINSGALGFGFADINRRVTHTSGNCDNWLKAGQDLCDSIPLFGLIDEIDQVRLGQKPFTLSRMTFPNDADFQADILIIWEENLQRFAIMATRTPKDEQTELAIMQNNREHRISKDLLIAAQQKKQIALEKYKRVFSAMDDAVIVFSKIENSLDAPTWRVSEANERSQKIVEDKFLQILGLKMEDIFSNELVEKVHYLVSGSTVADALQDFIEHEVKYPQSTWFKVHAAKTSPNELVVIFTDITIMHDDQHYVQNIASK